MDHERFSSTDDAWSLVQRLGHVDPPSAATLAAGRAAMVRPGRLRATGTVAGLVAAAAIVAIGSTVLPDQVDGEQTSVAQPGNRLEDDQVASPTAPTTNRDELSTVFTINAKSQGTLSLPFFLPSLREFSASEFVDAVVVGTVREVSYETSQGGAEVTTVAILDVQDSSAALADRLVVNETGGFVPASSIQRAVEKQLGRALTTTELAAQIEYSYDGREPLTVGDSVLVFLRRSARDSNSFDVLGRMNAVNQSNFDWAGDIPNGEWQSQISADAASELVLLNAQA